MLDLHFNILKELYNAEHRTMTRIVLENMFTGQIDEARSAIDILLSEKYLRYFVGSSSLKLTNKGIKEYQLELQRRNKDSELNAKDEKRYRSEKIKLTISVICNVVLGIIAIAEFILLCFGCTQ